MTYFPSEDGITCMSSPAAADFTEAELEANTTRNPAGTQDSDVECVYQAGNQDGSDRSGGNEGTARLPGDASDST
jgi:hypothetical protein